MTDIMCSSIAGNALYKQACLYPGGHAPDLPGARMCDVILCVPDSDTGGSFPFTVCFMCLHVCVRACVRACALACVRVCARVRVCMQTYITYNCYCIV